MMSRDKEESRKGISLSGGCCVICGWNKVNYKGVSLIVGAHIRGIRNTSDYDKHDNIIGLCPNHHAEFDNGNITIDLRRGKCLHIDDKDPFHNRKIIGNIGHIQPGYFDYHAKHVFKGKIVNGKKKL